MEAARLSDTCRILDCQVS